MAKKQPALADRFDLFLSGALQLSQSSDECGISRVILSQLKNGSIIANADQITAIAKWTGRDRSEVCDVLCGIVETRIAELRNLFP